MNVPGVNGLFCCDASLAVLFHIFSGNRIYFVDPKNAQFCPIFNSHETYHIREIRMTASQEGSWKSGLVLVVRPAKCFENGAHCNELQIYSSIPEEIASWVKFRLCPVLRPQVSESLVHHGVQLLKSSNPAPRSTLHPPADPDASPLPLEAELKLAAQAFEEKREANLGCVLVNPVAFICFCFVYFVMVVVVFFVAVLC